MTGRSNDKPGDELTDRVVATGTRVQVRNRFDGAWARGFEIAEAIDDEAAARYRLRRVSDACVLPTLFSSPEIAADTDPRDR